MKEVDVYWVDAFTNRVFGGNAAPVCVLKEWPPDAILQKITVEHNQSETAFFVPQGDGFELRWFTPGGEIDLCGHATLATSHVIFDHLGYAKDEIDFSTRFAGPLSVRKQDGWLTLNFPSWESAPVAMPANVVEGLGGMKPKESRLGPRDYMFVYDSEDDIRSIEPDFALLKKVDRYMSVTAPGNGCDFVSRFFCAGDGIDEDPVTGSAHSMLIPYWAKRLGKTKMLARQLSQRGGELRCEYLGERVLIGGQARTYMQGKIFLSD